jgi:hypothetical protein
VSDKEKFIGLLEARGTEYYIDPVSNRITVYISFNFYFYKDFRIYEFTTFKEKKHRLFLNPSSVELGCRHLSKNMRFENEGPVSLPLLESIDLFDPEEVFIFCDDDSILLGRGAKLDDFFDEERWKTVVDFDI